MTSLSFPSWLLSEKTREEIRRKDSIIKSKQHSLISIWRSIKGNLQPKIQKKSVRFSLRKPQTGNSLLPLAQQDRPQ